MYCRLCVLYEACFACLPVHTVLYYEYVLYYLHVLLRVCQLGLEESSDEEIKREKLFHIKDEKCSALPKKDGKTFTRVLIFKFAINRVQVKALLVPGQPLKPLVKATISWFL